MEWKEKPNYACSQAAPQKEHRPSVEQLSSNQPKQDLGPCTDRNQARYNLERCENIQNHGFPLLAPLISQCILCPAPAILSWGSSCCFALTLSAAPILRRRYIPH